METQEYIVKKYNIDISEPSPHMIPQGRFKDIPRLFRELGFKVGAEVGVFEGEYAKWLLRGVPGLKLYAIDAWEDYKGYKDYHTGTIVKAYEKAKKNVEGFDCTLIKEWSVEASRKFLDESLDFVFIDGNHDYPHVVEDLQAWTPKVRKGGIVYGHDFDDYSNKRRWKEMQVVYAVEGWTQAYKIDPWFVWTRNRNKCWMYVKN
jgi:predicted O-methyltransferase YrrM